MPRLPDVVPTLSDSDKIGWRDAEQRETRLLLVPTASDNFADLSAWTEVDSAANVNLAGGVVSMNGSDVWNQNGIRRTAGLAVAKESVQEFKVLGMGSVQTTETLALLDVASFSVLAADLRLRINRGNSAYATYTAAENQVTARTPILNDTVWYTVRMYVLKDADGVLRKYRITLEGGDYSEETTVLEGESVSTCPATVYPCFQRNTNDAGNLTQIKEWAWKTGYPTDGPYASWVHDAGAGQVFSGLDFTNFAMPGTVPSTNLKFRYSFDDGTPSFSGWLTLAELNAVGAVAGTKRYLRLDVQNNSDGGTQVYGAKPNADDAIESVGAASGGGGAAILGSPIVRAAL